MNTRKPKFLIYPRFQAVLVLLNSAVIVGFFATTMIALHRANAQARAQGLAQGLSEGHSYFKVIEMQTNMIYQSVSIALLVSLALSIALTLFWSHRLAGPLLRMKRYFEGLAQGGERKPFSVRKGDFIEDLAQAINQALSKISK